MKRSPTYSFRAVLSPVEAYISTVIFLPRELMENLPAGRKRARGTINGAPFDLAIQYRKEGLSFFIVSASLRKAAKMKAGDKVEVIFKLIDPDKLELPEELETVLAQDDDGMKAWNKLTPGYQRSLAHYVTSVKNVDSRIKRALELVNKLKMGKLYVQKSKE